MTSSDVLFWPQHKDIQFTVTVEETNQKIFTFKQPESENLDFSVSRIVNNQPVHRCSSNKILNNELICFDYKEIQ